MDYGPASKYYDLFGSKDDIEFYRSLAIEHGRKALELGVGTGRVAVELARANVKVWGIDNSRYMLNVARQKLRKEKTTVRKRLKLKLADMHKFKLDECFPFAYAASSTFEHCTTVEAKNSCLASVHSVFDKNAVLAFDVSQPQKKLESAWYIDRAEVDGEEVVRTIFSRTNPQTDIVSVNLFFDVYRNGRFQDRYHEYGEARIWSKDSLEKTLQDVGFKITNVYGSFKKSAYSKHSPTIVFVCIKI